MSEKKSVLERFPEYEVVIGIEVHVQLATRTKIFCACANQVGNSPNSSICPICAGYPGVLPVLNEKVVEYGIMAGLATHCTIATRSEFDRKHYFYPDLPKGYQITQQRLPICTDGYVPIRLEDGTVKKVRLARIHIEEDAGKSIHAGTHETFVDLNRAGTPLLEIVTLPDIASAAQAKAYLKMLRAIVQYLGICSGNMEEGAFRADTNISVRKKGGPLGTKVELKNINSFKRSGGAGGAGILVGGGGGGAGAMEIENARLRFGLDLLLEALANADEMIAKVEHEMKAMAQEGAACGGGADADGARGGRADDGVGVHDGDVPAGAVLERAAGVGDAGPGPAGASERGAPTRRAAPEGGTWPPAVDARGGLLGLDPTRPGGPEGVPATGAQHRLGPESDCGDGAAAGSGPVAKPGQDTGRGLTKTKNDGTSGEETDETAGRRQATPAGREAGIRSRGCPRGRGCAARHVVRWWRPDRKRGSDHPTLCLRARIADGIPRLMPLGRRTLDNCPHSSRDLYF